MLVKNAREEETLVDPRASPPAQLNSCVLDRDTDRAGAVVDRGAVVGYYVRASKICRWFLEDVVGRGVGGGVVRVAGVRRVRVAVGRRVRDRRRVSAVGERRRVSRAHHQPSLVARRCLHFRFGPRSLDRLRLEWFGESDGHQGEQNDGLQMIFRGDNFEK